MSLSHGRSVLHSTTAHLGAVSCAGVLLLLVQSAWPVEPWADRNPSVTDGLVSWHDTNTENAVRKAAGLPRIADGGLVDTWHDASGTGRHRSQQNQESQPRLRASEEWRFIRFDGQQDFLRAEGLGLSFEDATVFLVAAPFANDGGFRAFLAMNAIGKNDYTSGLNLELGGAHSRNFAALNIEGAGFGGERNLKPNAGAFGVLHRMCVSSSSGQGGTQLWLNGESADQRAINRSIVSTVCCFQVLALAA